MSLRCVNMHTMQEVCFDYCWKVAREEQEGQKEKQRKVILSGRQTLLHLEKKDAELQQMLLNGWIQVSAGGSHTCGILRNNMAFCWGANNFGQSKIPPRLRNALFRQIAAGIDYTCA